ncbi:uncharacterized protein PHALS_08441 [Plasmopara halstedii]|uniref:Uncharacterized protein n=1 Tax=Plasmopara halstedii TaxID=4781 RepID=A0A0P1ACY2_PLAHL|nr:uncharacterized protein PHALS_08441 [Plasmopara halstedii]CEG38362.1 hypothetical protein PHALS_08441 [Plasmopara halstedii]|eukprot:XP_024574731.1 hypothetical protein PHALS_08441 [Plasmopara halstedii]
MSSMGMLYTGTSLKTSCFSMKFEAAMKDKIPIAKIMRAFLGEKTRFSALIVEHLSG